jgi:hypothetical protein
VLSTYTVKVGFNLTAKIQKDKFDGYRSNAMSLRIDVNHSHSSHGVTIETGPKVDKKNAPLFGAFNFIIASDF